jgi:hypothetical protein
MSTTNNDLRQRTTSASSRSSEEEQKAHQLHQYVNSDGHFSLVRSALAFTFELSPLIHALVEIDMLTGLLKIAETFV